MFRGGKWRGEKSRIKVVFRLQFKATQVPPSKGENLVVTLIPVDVGKPTARSDKASATAGTCQWERPVYETVKFVREPKTGKISEKIYHILVSPAGLPKAALLGETTIDFAFYAEAIKPSSLSLPLKASDFEVLLHVTIERSRDELLRRRENGEPQRRTLLTQLSNSDQGDDEEQEINGDEEFSPKLTGSRSFDAVSLAWSDFSSARRSAFSLLSPLGGVNGTPQRPSFSPSDGGEDRRSNAEELAVLARQVEVSDLELQALRKQVVKERKLNLELSQQVKTLTAERDGFKKECEETRGFRRENGDERERLRSSLEEVRNELEKEKAQNDVLRRQLVNIRECRDDEQYALEALVKETPGEVEFHGREGDEMEMQMEQLALDYEILKQENHEISARLEQIQLREQLRMQYECSAHTAIISELEGQVEGLKAEIERQTESFEADLTDLQAAKFEREKRVIELEEALRKAKRQNVMMSEYLMEEVEGLSAQMLAMFGKNEKLVLQALGEAGLQRRRNSQLEEALRMAEERYRSRIEELETEIVLGKGHIERLYARLKEKTEESDESRRLIKRRIIVSGPNGDVRRELGRARLSGLFEKYKERLLANQVEADGAVGDSHKDARKSDDEKLLSQEPGQRSFALASDTVETEMKESGIGTEAANGLCENRRLREMNRVMEEELREMRERYSEISLKFAQVEGERQELVMTVRALKNSMKS